MQKLEHIGIAVKDLDIANLTYAALLGEPHYKIESVESEGVNTSFFKCGNTKIELLEATTTKSPIASYIEKRGEGVHHLAFLVEDIHSEVVRLKELGFNIINETPRKGADNKLVVFVHPKSSNGVLIELCQEIN